MGKIKIVLLTLLIISCKQSIEKEPDNLISKEKMINLLSDIHRIEGVVNNLGIQSSDTTSFIYRKMEAQLFKKHKVDTSAYYKSFKYYLGNPDEFTEMYKEVVLSIKEKNKIDSLKEAKLNINKLDTNKNLDFKKERLGKNRSAKFDSIKTLYKNQILK